MKFGTLLLAVLTLDVTTTTTSRAGATKFSNQPLLGAAPPSQSSCFCQVRSSNNARRNDVDFYTMSVAAATSATTRASTTTTRATRRRRRFPRSSSATASSDDNNDVVIAQRLVKLIQPQLFKLANPQNAKYRQDYLKSEMPMYGLQRTERASIEKSMWELLDQEIILQEETADENNNNKKKKKSKNKILPQSLYRECVETLWNLPKREEKYLAIDLAMHYPDCITLQNLPLYEQMLRNEYMWWDLVDPIAVNLVGTVALKHYDQVKPILQQWIQDETLWIRRTALLAQLKFKNRTDQDVLFESCRSCMHEKEFFIRKAIGWALREYSKTAPEAVKTFLEQEKPRLSGLSFREGSKILVKNGWM